MRFLRIALFCSSSLSPSSSISVSSLLTFGSGALAPHTLKLEVQETPASPSSSAGLLAGSVSACGKATVDCWDLKLGGNPEIQPRSPLMSFTSVMLDRAEKEDGLSKCFGEVEVVGEGFVVVDVLL